ncbi:hypothetical protein FB451DRAFT_1187689 [Mycena latifolia]|nr:hypothetical protein FB451DRAFT_1187689 [Mycena latifolia]
MIQLPAVKHRTSTYAWDPPRQPQWQHWGPSRPASLTCVLAPMLGVAAVSTALSTFRRAVKGAGIVAEAQGTEVGRMQEVKTSQCRVESIGGRGVGGYHTASRTRVSGAVLEPEAGGMQDQLVDHLIWRRLDGSNPRELKSSHSPDHLHWERRSDETWIVWSIS